MTNVTATYKRLGDYIREVDVRNTDELLSEDDLYGVSVTKEFITTHANLVGVRFNNYKVVNHGQFTYISDTSRRGEKIALAYNYWGKDIIVSSVYTVFEITDYNKLLPEYLMMWFRRPEFDRYARFHSHGSAREVFDWEEMCNVMLPVPSIEEQRSIVNRYKAIERRIDNNKQIIAKLEEAAQALYRKMFVDGIDVENLPEGWRMGTLGDIYEFQYGKGNNNPSNGGQYPVYGGNGIIGGFDEFNSEDSPVIGHIGIKCGSLFYEPQKHFVTYNGIICRSKTDYKYFNYGSLLKSDLQSQVRGSSQPFISYDMLYEINVVLPTENLQAKYNQRAVDLFGMSILFQKENELLMEMLSMVMA